MMEPFEIEKNGYVISTDKKRLDFDVIHGYLQRSYWSPGIPIEIVKKAAGNAETFGMYLSGKQVGYARVVTDYATFAYLADVFILEAERGKGLSKWLIETIRNAPFLQGLRRWMLATRDAHGLYEQYGFTALDKPELFMEITNQNVYLETARN